LGTAEKCLVGGLDVLPQSVEHERRGGPHVGLGKAAHRKRGPRMTCGQGAYGGIASTS